MRSKVRIALVCCAGLLYGICSLAAPLGVEGADMNAEPSITLGEEYNDNPLLRRNNKVEDYITSVSPAIHVLSNSPLWDWDVAYAYTYRYYVRRTLSDDSANTLNLVNRTRVIDQYLFLDVTDIYNRVSLDVARDYTQESNVVNQTDTNTLYANPYFRLKLTKQSILTLGYGYRNIWYKDTSAADSDENIGYIEMKQDVSSRLTVTSKVLHDDQTFHQNGARTHWKRDDVSVVPGYEFAEGSLLTLGAGNSWFDFGDGRRNSQVFWDAGILHRYSTITASFMTGASYVPDPLYRERRLEQYVAAIKRDTDRLSLGMSAGMRHYRSVETKDIVATSRFVTGVMSHQVNEKVKLSLDATVDRNKDDVLHTSTVRYLGGLRLERLLAEGLTLAGIFRYSSVYTPEDYAGSYDNNRVTIELRKVF